MLPEPTSRLRRHRANVVNRTHSALSHQNIRRLSSWSSSSWSLFFLETGLACLHLVSKWAANPKQLDLRKEQDLDSNRKTRMKNNNHDQEDLARLSIRSTQNRVQVPQQEEDCPAEANTHKSPVERRERAPAH